ncbi:AbiTii domain-containing protein [Cellulomonas chengniuliangii]|uniref:AbiTii domain-containing protein n=1 Tax=Cellulomonas chengniuliangii TaxID=2968084 RepID=A0ABY5KXA8_9CELL|nr:hypothetical protein [Cellulomonas chengniuliangii]MCC2309314.1 hypothetical protein [Cellulomonas chengniuliangii]MCC2316584.1 hypothetical protein [Cellulomonas chengniuliangii]UUI75117.1 hypothetical protein NP064_15295 [Cellulomonas chengniuliangii]
MTGGLMSRLSALIDQAADSARPLSDVLRQVKIVAARIDDPGLAEWSSKELTGYGTDDQLPTYRSKREFPVLGNWSGPFGSAVNNAPISSAGITDGFLDWFQCEIRHPVAELEALSDSGQDPTIRWDPWAVVEYNRRTENGEGGATFEMMSLLDARLVIPRNALTGILDMIRTRVLDLALALEGVAPDAGEPDGPTVANKRVEAVTQTFHITVNGDGANIATGDHVRQRSTIKKGDVDGLLEAARTLGLDNDSAAEFHRAIEADGGHVGENTRSFVERVRSGVVSLVGSIAANVAATGLLELAAQFAGAVG